MEDGEIIPLLAPDAFMPSQFADLHRSANGPNAPIKNLMLAILEISLRDSTGIRSARGSGRPATTPRWQAQRLRLARERRRDARAWIFCDGDGVFSFASVCDVLGVDSEALRARVRGKNPRLVA